MLATRSVRGAGACVLYTGFRNRDGYGMVRFNGAKIGAHRLAWMLAHGRDIPVGMVVRHTCDVPACVNPAHLALGTVADNVRDREVRRRSAWATVTHCPQGHPYDEANTTTRLRRRLGVTGKVRFNRTCKTCRRARDRQRAAAARLATPQPEASAA